MALPQAAPGGTPGRANYGLFGASSRQQEGLAPYSGMQRMVPGTPSKAGDEDGPAVLSQEAAVQLSQEAPQQPAQPASQHSFSQVGGDANVLACWWSMAANVACPRVCSVACGGLA